MPIMFSEIVIGRRGRMSPINSLRELATDAGSTKAWMGLGILGVVAGFLVLSFYSVVAGWTLHYGVSVREGTGRRHPHYRSHGHLYRPSGQRRGR